MAPKHPQGDLLKTGAYLTSGGLESSLIFNYGVTLTHLAAFELLSNAEGRNILFKYYKPYLNIARKYGLNFILETPTWRANSDWGYRLGYSEEELAQFNRNAVCLIRDLKCLLPSRNSHVVLSGNLGPRDDGYIHKKVMTPEEAQAYHRAQIRTFTEAEVDVVTALALNDIHEATGIVLAAKEAGVSVVISFTVNTDGRLPSGEKVEAAITEVDRLTDSYASYFMINCGHAEPLIHLFVRDSTWKLRIRGNVLTKSHAELNELKILDTSGKQLLTAGYAKLQRLLPNLKVISGCCDTDRMEVICDSLLLQ